MLWREREGVPHWIVLEEEESNKMKEWNSNIMTPPL